MLRLLKSNKTFKKVFDVINMNVGIVKMITVTVSVFFLVHLIGCLWFMQAKLNDFDPDTWVVRSNFLDEDPGL
jgi:Ion channel